jgi:hypothetical protein
MEIRLTRLQKKATCRHCGKAIESGSIAVVGVIWFEVNKKGGEKGKWRKVLYWHTKNEEGECCWLNQGIQAIEKLPTKHSYLGRKPLQIADEVKAKRLAVIRRRAAVMQRIRIEVEEKETPSMENLIHLGAMLERLKREIEPLGGAPKSWD